MPILQGTRRAARKPAAALAVVAAVLVAVGCSSNSSSSTSAASSSTASTSASASASASSTSGGSGLSAADQAGLAKAQAFLATAEKRPTQITNTVKVTGTIPKGKTIDFITCGATPECTQEGQLVQDADNLLGWSTVILNNDGSSAAWKNDFAQVVRTKPAAVLFTGIPAALYASDAAALKANGTFVSTCCVTDEAGPSTGIGYAIDTPNQVGPIGGAQAALVAADSKDTANSVIVNLPDLPILDNGVTDYKAGMATYCPTCQVSELDIALANIATAPSTIVSYVRAHPSIKYVVAATDGLTVGLPAALKAAGLSDVQIVGQGATATNLQYMHSGEQAGDVAFPYYEVMWSMVNAVAQHEAGMTVTPSVAPPLWVLTPSNAPTSSLAFPLVVNYESQFKALWGLG
jgi:ABC-type sugar transport system substrate-binding protein